MEVFEEDLEAAAEMYDSLIDGTFYDKQEEAHQYLKEESKKSRDWVRETIETQVRLGR